MRFKSRIKARLRVAAISEMLLTKNRAGFDILAMKGASCV